MADHIQAELITFVLRAPFIKSAYAENGFPEKFIEEQGDLAQAVLSTEQTMKKAQEAFEQAGSLEEVDRDELAFIDKALQYIYTPLNRLTSLASRVRNQQPVAEDDFFDAYITLQAAFYSLRIAVGNVYHHDIIELQQKRYGPE